MDMEFLITKICSHLLQGLYDDSFENYRAGLIAKLLEKDPSLHYETNRFWLQITDKMHMFDYAKREAEQLRSIQKEEVINWYKTYLQQSSPKCRRLAICVWGCNTDLKEAEARPESVKVIEDLAAFKMSSEFYPSISEFLMETEHFEVLLFARFYLRLL
ncbi:putative insulysin [Rosa chinensis]|uniref:Putative insulysin n=1 Tax=Rosa chinensis TaxID=74649 RepID=A0A2P6QL43_ROSCH|nr:putative insulysin [Rosa chinensis]